MERKRSRWRFAALPTTRPGRWAAGLLTVAVALLLVGNALVASGQQGGEKFSDNLWLAILLLGAGLSALLAGGAAVFAVGFRRERSLPAFLALLVGLLVAWFLIGEIATPH